MGVCRIREKLLAMLIMSWCGVTNAQLPPLVNWDFSQSIELDSGVLQDFRLGSIFVDDMLLVMHPSLGFGDNCGQAVLLSANQDGMFVPVQHFSAEDFGMGCDQQDGFGFSADYANGLLVIGAPGQVFLEPGQRLNRGYVYVYQLDTTATDNQDNEPFTQIARIRGVRRTGNFAWGTKVKTDGNRILVQGNQNVGVETALAHNRAIARSLNLLEADADGTWNITHEFSGDSTIYAQDFLINDQEVLITQHEYRYFERGWINSDSVNIYNSAIEVYDLESTGNTELLQVIDLGRSGVFTRLQERSEDNYQDIQQLYFQDNNVVVFIPKFAGFDGASTISWFQTAQNGEYQQVESQHFETQRLRLDEYGNINGIAIYEADPSGRATVTGYNLKDSTSEKTVQQVIAARGNKALNVRSRVEDFRLNASNDRLLLVKDQELIMFAARPALDPAITGLWWFGPQFDGQGITLEVLLGNRLLMHWFTYDSSGRQMWVRGSGVLNNGKVNMQLARARGPRFPLDEFDPDDRVVEIWGEAEFTFNNCRNGRMDYQSEEFGADSLEISLLADNAQQCERGFIINDEGIELAPRFRSARSGVTSPFTQPKITIIGSAFDATRSGEGIIFLPARVDAEDDSSRSIVGLWLTYDQMGEQAWYYLGVFEDCFGNGDCRWQPNGPPRMPEGPMFGQNYNPQDRIVTPWGFLGPINRTRTPINSDVGVQVSVDFENPHGSGTLVLRKLVDAIGY